MYDTASCPPPDLAWVAVHQISAESIGVIPCTVEITEMYPTTTGRFPPTIGYVAPSHVQRGVEYLTCLAFLDLCGAVHWHVMRVIMGLKDS